MLIVLDAGHDLNTPGKRTPAIQELNNRVIKEYEFNSAVVELLDKELKRCGFNTLITAPDGNKVYSLKYRTDLANNAKADAFISIHYNALDGRFDGNDPEGLSVHVQPGKEEGKKLGLSVLKYLNEKEIKQKNRGLKEDNFHVTRETKMPAILTENGFMDNKKEAMLMINQEFIKQVAVAHAKGICEYFNVKYIAELEKNEVLNWKQKIIKEALDLGIITDKEWVNKPDELVSVWFVLSVGLNIYKKLKK